MRLGGTTEGNKSSLLTLYPLGLGPESPDSGRSRSPNARDGAQVSLSQCLEEESPGHALAGREREQPPKAPLCPRIKANLSAGAYGLCILCFLLTSSFSPSSCGGLLLTLKDLRHGPTSGLLHQLFPLAWCAHPSDGHKAASFSSLDG